MNANQVCAKCLGGTLFLAGALGLVVGLTDGCTDISLPVEETTLVSGLVICTDEYLLPEEFARVTDVTPRSAFPGQFVVVSGENFGPPRRGRFEVQFNGAPGTIVEPFIAFCTDPEQSRIDGFLVIVPPQGTTGPVTVVLPKFEDPDEQTMVTSSVEFEVKPLSVEIPDPTPSVSVPVTFHSLGPPLFTSEVADSKDVVVNDLDGDGDLDMFIPQTLDMGETVYRNDGVGDLTGNPRFTVLVDRVINDTLPKRQYGANSADMDGDGLIDVMPSGASPQSTPKRVRMLINNGDLTFSDETTERIIGLDDIIGEGYGWDDVKFGDIDDDGDLDIAIANRATGNERSALILNIGGGRYRAIEDAFGEPGSEVHHDVLLCDLNNDGLPDVILSQDIRSSMRPLRVVLNKGGRSFFGPEFVDGSDQFVPNPAAHTEHLGCQDFNNDGMMDVHVGVWGRSDQDPDGGRAREDMIYLNESVDSNGNGVIDLDEIRMVMVDNPEPDGVLFLGFDAATYSGAYGDFDGDGFVDIIVGSNAPDPGRKGPFLMRNNQDGTFTNISMPNSFWPNLTNSSFDHFNPTSPTVGDFNGDGLLDVVFGMGDLMNGVFEEANRIYIQQRRITP